MSNNKTRKSLAGVSAFALVSAGFVGAPAFAAGTVDGKVTLAPSAGTTYTMLTGEKFDLAANFSTAADNGTNLKFYVTDAASISRFDVVNSDSLTTTDTLSAIDETDMSAATDFDITVASGIATVVVGLGAASGFEVGDVVNVDGLAGTFDGSTALTADDIATLEGDQVVTAVSNSSPYSFTFKVDATDLSTFTNGATATAVDFVEQTSRIALDSAADLLLGTFGAVGVTGAIAEKTTAAAGRNADGSYIVDTADTDDAGVDSTLRLVTTAAGSVSVQAWVDSDDDNVIDDNEFASPVRTVTFVDYDDVTFTTALTAPVLAGTTLTATVTVGNDVNMAQIVDGTITVDFKKDGTTISGQGAVAANYNSTDLVLKAAPSGLTALSAGIFSAGATYVTAEDTVGDTVYKTLTAAATDISSVTAAAALGSANVSGSTIKTGTTSVTLSSTVKYWSAYGSPSTESAAPANVPAVVTITKSTLAAGSTVSAGGKTLASTGTSISFDTVTNADGKVVFDLTATGTKGTVVTVDVKVEDKDTTATPTAAPTTPAGGYKAASTTTLTWADPTIASIDDLSIVGFGGVGQMAKGGTYTLSYDVRDNFGAASAVAGTYRVHMTSTTNAGGATAWTATAPVSGGKATYTFSDDTVALSGNVTVAAKLQKLNTAGTAYADVSGITTSTTIYVATKAAASVTTTTKATAGLTLEPKDFITGDLRLDANSQTHAYTSGNGWELTGTVKDSTGAPIPGASVTVAAAGIAFVANNANGSYADGTHAVGSITVNANASGVYSVKAWSHTAGTVSFTVTSGAASATTSQTWAYPTSFDKYSNITVTLPASASPASVVKGSIALTDKWGNAIKNAESIVFTQTGPGYVVTSPSAVSAATGTADFVLLTGANDSGTAVITVTHQLGTAAVTTDDIVATASVVIGTAGNTGAYSSWTKKLDDNSAKMYAKNVVGEGKVQFFLNGEEIAWVRAVDATDPKLRTANGSAYLVRTVEFEDGKNVLEIYVDGVRTTRTAYTK